MTDVGLFFLKHLPSFSRRTHITVVKSLLLKEASCFNCWGCVDTVLCMVMWLTMDDAAFLESSLISLAFLIPSSGKILSLATVIYWVFYMYTQPTLVNISHVVQYLTRFYMYPFPPNTGAVLSGFLLSLLFLWRHIFWG